MEHKSERFLNLSFASLYLRCNHKLVMRIRQRRNEVSYEKIIGIFKRL